MSREAGRPVVLKFGGAALATPARIRRAARRVAAWAGTGRRPVVVVSACGDTTDRITRWLDGVTGGRAVPGREADRALATGEDLAASLLAAGLQARGVTAVGLRGGDAGLVGAGPHGQARIRRVDPATVEHLLLSGTVPVVAGFQAASPAGETVTLGRGASDLSAVVLAAALGAGECHLVKDVSGVHDRDPRLHPEARLLPLLRPPELRRLAAAGGIVQPAAVDAAGELAVRLRIYGFRDPVFGAHGTTVEPEDAAHPPGARVPDGDDLGPPSRDPRGGRPPEPLTPTTAVPSGYARTHRWPPPVPG